MSQAINKLKQLIDERKAGDGGLKH